MSEARYQVANKAHIWSVWAKSNTRSELEVFESHGMGLKTPVAVKEGDVLLRVPSSLCITTSTCLDDQMGKWMLQATGEGPHLLHRAVVYLALQSQTQWTPYFKLLPTPQDLSLPFTWAQEEIKDLEGTSIGDATTTKRRFIDAMYRSCPPLPGLSPALWHLAYEWIASRSLTHPQTGEHVLVPVLDLVNHSSSANARYDFDGKDFLLFATKDIVADSEILIDYGVRSAGEFLFKYGFVPAAPDTQIIRTYDPMHEPIREILDVSRDPDVPDKQTKEMLEAAYSILTQFVGATAFQIRDGTWSDNLIVLVALEDLVELKCVDGVYDLYIGKDPIDPTQIQSLRVGEVAERADVLARKLAQYLQSLLPESGSPVVQELVNHEQKVYNILGAASVAANGPADPPQ